MAMGGDVGEKMAIRDVVFQPDGNQFLVCAGRKILIYDAKNGCLVKSLDGHDGQIHTLSYSIDGQYFASGGDDHCVIVWTSEGNSMQKYSHEDAVQRVLFNPVKTSLASSASMEVGLWSLDSQNVVKFKTTSKVLSLAWSKDGELIALGMLSGQISFRDKKGIEIVSVVCDGSTISADLEGKATDMRLELDKNITVQTGPGSCKRDVKKNSPRLLKESNNMPLSTYTAGEFEDLLHVYMSNKEFEKASSVFKKHEGGISKACKIHYAEWLLTNGSYNEAIQIFQQNCVTEKYLDVIEKLASCTVKLETYFNDASYYLWLLGSELSKRVPEGVEDSRSESYIQASHLYYAYHMVNEFCDDPFTILQPKVLLRASLFLLNSLAEISEPSGISRAKILYNLLKQALVLQINDIARFAYSQLQSIKCSRVWDDSIELSYMMLETAETKATANLMDAMCYRCGVSNPLLNLSEALNSKGDRCVHCYHPFKRCFLTFTILPLVEITPGNSSGQDESSLILNQQSSRPDPQMTVLSHETDLKKNMLEALNQKQGIENNTPMVVDQGLLHCFDNKGATFTVKTPKRRHFRNVDPDICITLGPSDEYGCFFLSAEYELAVLKSGRCPFSRVQVTLHSP